MDAVTALLAEARAAGLRLTVDGEALIVRGPKTAEPIVRRLRDAKPAVLDALRVSRSPDASGSLTRSDTFTKNEFIARAHGEIYGNTRQDASAAQMRQPPTLSLDPATVREVLGPDADDPHAVACLRFDVLVVVRAIEAGIRSGVLPPRRLVHGKPLADWLGMDQLAQLMGAWDMRTRRT
jgi:hypothetical protein